MRRSWIVLPLLVLNGCAVSLLPPPKTPPPSRPAARRVIATDRAPQALATYSQAIEVGDTLYLAGQVGLDPKTRELVPGGLPAEAKQALENCKAVLEAAGYTLRDVVQVQVLLADIADYQTFNGIYAPYFATEPPARAAYAVAALPRGARVEIVMTAAHAK